MKLEYHASQNSVYEVTQEWKILNNGFLKSEVCYWLT